MPIRIQNDLPAKAILERENIFVMDENRAMSQDIRPLEILILNLMPLKEDTELQLLRALSRGTNFSAVLIAVTAFPSFVSVTSSSVYSVTVAPSTRFDGTAS